MIIGATARAGAVAVQFKTVALLKVPLTKEIVAIIIVVVSIVVAVVAAAVPIPVAGAAAAAAFVRAVHQARKGVFWRAWRRQRKQGPRHPALFHVIFINVVKQRVVLIVHFISRT